MFVPETVTSVPTGPVSGLAVIEAGTPRTRASQKIAQLLIGGAPKEHEDDVNAEEVITYSEVIARFGRPSALLINAAATPPIEPVGSTTPIMSAAVENTKSRLPAVVTPETVGSDEPPLDCV